MIFSDTLSKTEKRIKHLGDSQFSEHFMDYGVLNLISDIHGGLKNISDILWWCEITLRPFIGIVNCKKVKIPIA